MFRFLSRVVVVSVVALSLNFSVVPASQARMLQTAKAASGESKRCVDQAMEWLNQVLGKGAKVSKKNPKKMAGNDGGCIDPMGNPRPCS